MMMQGQVNVAFTTSHELHEGQIQGKATSHDSGQIETVAGNHRQHHSQPSPWH